MGNNLSYGQESASNNISILELEDNDTSAPKAIFSSNKYIQNAMKSMVNKPEHVK